MLGCTGPLSLLLRYLLEQHVGSQVPGCAVLEIRLLDTVLNDVS